MNWTHEAVARDLVKRSKKFIAKANKDVLKLCINNCIWYVKFSEDKEKIAFGSGEIEFVLPVTAGDDELYKNFLSVLEKFNSRAYRIEYYV